jgi:hypothetical protein
VGSTEYEESNFLSPGNLLVVNLVLLGNSRTFWTALGPISLTIIAHLIPWINALRREVFLSGFRWTAEDLSQYDRMRAALEQAMRVHKVKAGWPEETEW